VLVWASRLEDDTLGFVPDVVISWRRLGGCGAWEVGSFELACLVAVSLEGVRLALVDLQEPTLTAQGGGFQ
jgi:hypothetical protein